MNRILVLAVIDDSPGAATFYASQGFAAVGTFVGRHGVNQVFVDAGSLEAQEVL